MELLDVIRVLSRRPFLILAGALVAIALFAVTKGGPSGPPGATAETRVALDTPKSQAVTVAKQGADTLVWRAGLLADQMASEPIIDEIASEIDVSPDQIAVVDPYLATPTVPTPVARAASEAASISGAPNVLTVSADRYLPMITVVTVAPNVETAKALATAATERLRSAASPVHTAAVQGFTVEPVSHMRVRTLPGSHGRLTAIGAALVFFCLWCATVAIAPALLRTWRAAVRLERAPTG